MDSSGNAVATIQRLSQASACLDKSSMWEAKVAAEAAKEVLKRSCRDLVDEAAGMPMLTSKSCDGTPIRVTHRTSTKLPSGREVRSQGRAGQEFLVCNQFIRAEIPGSGWQTRVYLGEAVPLTHGKSAPSIIAASFRDWSTLRELGHHGCCVEHYVWDRASITALDRMVRQYHASKTQSLLPPSVSQEHGKLTQFVVVTPCALHDSQNAFRWSLFEECNDTALMRDTYVAVESLRNSHDLLSIHLSEWVTTRLQFVGDMGPERVNQRRTLWSALGVDHEAVDILSELQFSYDAGRLTVVHTAGDIYDDVVSVIIACLSSVWRFVKFTTSRWLTVGTSARALVAALLTGVENLVAYIDTDTSSGKFYLGGFSRLVRSRKQYMVKAAIASRIAEAFQLELMEDSRVAVVYETLWRSIAKEMKWLVDLDISIWHTLGCVCGLSADQLRDACIVAGHITVHFLWRRVLHPASCMPWSLCRGDIEQNLRDLAASDYPDDAVGQQLWTLLQADFNIEQLKGVVRCLAEVGWTSLVAEQQHGSLAAFRKHHAEYGTETLITRSFLMQVSRLLPKQSAEDRRISSTLRRLRKLESSDPSKASGRHEMLKSLLNIAYKKKAEGNEAFDMPTTDLNKHWFSRHSAYWAQQSLRARAQWTARARHAASAKRTAIREEQEALEKKIDELISRHSLGQQDCPPLSMSAAAIGE